MAGVGKLLKQAQKMQKKIEETNQALFDEKVEVSFGGSAVKLVLNGHGEPKSLEIDAEFLKEDKKTVEEALLAAFSEGVAKAKAVHQEKMQAATAGFTLGGAGM